MTGTVTLNTMATAQTEQGECAGYAAMDDINAGASVVVSDSSGATVAMGQLAPATDYSLAGACTFPFSVDGVPDSEFYRVEVAGRGAVSVTRSDVLDKQLNLSIG